MNELCLEPLPNQNDVLAQRLNESAELHPGGGWEIWRDVVGWAGYYRVSNWGRVKSVERVVTCRDGRRQLVPERLLKQGQQWQTGYCHVSLCNGSKRCPKGVHHLVLEAFVGP